MLGMYECYVCVLYLSLCKQIFGRPCGTGLGITMSKLPHTRTADDDNGLCLNKHACQTAKSLAHARFEVFENVTAVGPLSNTKLLSPLVRALNLIRTWKWTYVMSLLLTFRHRMPAELQIPIESAHIDARRVAVMKLQCCIIDNINNGTDNSCRVACYAIQQWFQPT